ncbi:MAG: DUF4340 domain-containing protein [Alphaproteobacteria bacterium]|nr:DUF4340 domain-containing protein [Alphaproteobacteria bacterium]
MSERLTNILGYLTLFAILGAIWVLFGEDPTREQGGRGEPTFEGIKASINDVAALKLEKSGSTVTLQKTGEGWQVAERGGYAADISLVRDFLRGVALSERREPKTANPERFGEIGLGTEALKVTLAAKDDSTMLAFDMGKQSMIGSDRSLTYVFQEKDTRAWLVTALAEASGDPAWWLDKSLLDITATRFRAVTMGGVTLERPLGATDYTLAGLKDGEKAVPAWRLGEPARVLSGLGFEDVRHLGNPLSDPKATVVAHTHDGLMLSLALYDMEGATWVQVTASFDATEQSTGEEGTLPDAPADVAAEAVMITGKTHGWFFRLDDADAQALLQKRADFLVADTPENDPTS